VIDLGDIGFEIDDPGDEGSFGINDWGEVAFALLDGGSIKSAIWLPASAYGLAAGTHLPSVPAPGHPSMLRECNETGVFVGQAGGLLDGEGRGLVIDFLESPHRVELLVADDSDATWSRALSVNDGDPPVILGRWRRNSHCDPCSAQTPTAGYLRSFRVLLDDDDPDEWTYTELSPSPDLPERCDPASVAHDIAAPTSSTLVVAGSSGTQIDPSGPVCQQGDAYVAKPVGWTPGPNDLDLLGTRENNARGVNDHSEFVGWRYAAALFPRALYWSSLTADVFELGNVMPDGQENDRSWAEAINNNAFPQVVGFGENPFDGQRALLWERQDSQSDPWIATDLNDEIAQCWRDDIVLKQAHDINDYGWIVAWGDSDTEEEGIQPHAYVLIPLNGCTDSDINGDGLVGFADVLRILANWGPCSQCDEDVNDDGDVGFADVLIVLGDWGLCPAGCTSPIGPPTLAETIACMGLDLEEWDECLSNGTSADDANCICWLEHYYDVHCNGTCLCSPNCPDDDDPWGGHE
jgi:hypothetical protein